MQVEDQMGRLVCVKDPPKRIISLVPSQTELLFDLGLDEEIIGITKFCIHPASRFKSTTKIGGTKKLNFPAIRELKPDLIIGNKEENEKLQIEELMNEFPVWMSDISTLEDALEMITQLGSITGKSHRANSICSEILAGFNSLRDDNIVGKSVAYFIWKDPFMIAGKDTFIDSILKHAGFENFSQEMRYPELTLQQLKEAKPDIIMLSSEPYPFKDVHVSEMQGICPGAEVLIVDGEMFSWYGSRLLHTSSYLKTLKGLLK
ncbi:ABC transporter substrate-binding protein [Daejeonella lutea]|uniref:Substrate-binding protein n=1 Tax=Daejeonella lutea TaxID=572036 RepID=A0A1T5F753_9SPHI|nr:helical backbone metal receptor [Daejeonella lutea]SKB91951.1 substrate-binding protein [Daejeonella lutea]